jgi:hypothetical protein
MAKKAFLTVAEKYRKVKKKYLTVNGVYRRVKKAYETVNGVYVLRWSGGWDTWKKYRASRSWVNGYYKKYTYQIGQKHTNGDYYGNPVSIMLYDGYTFSESSGFSGTTLSANGQYKIDSTHVYKVIELAADQDKSKEDNIYVNITFECIDAALYYSGYYSYSKGTYIEDVEAEEGQLPTTETPAQTEDNGNRIYVQENGSWYCYEKPKLALAVLDNAIIGFDVLA